MDTTPNNTSAPDQTKQPPTPATPLPSTPPIPPSQPTPTHDLPKPSEKTDSTPPLPLTATPPPKKGLPFLFVILLLVVSFLVGLILATLYFQSQLKELSSQENSKAPATVAKETKLIIGTDATFEPMEFVNEQGSLMGYDIDLGQQLGTELNAKVEYKNIADDALFKALETKQIDMIISSITITDERRQKYDVTEPYLYAGQVFIINKDSAASDTASLKDGKIGVQEGTTGETEALKYTSDAQITRYPDLLQSTTALREKKIDAVISDLTSTKALFKTQPDLQILGEPLTNEAYGIVLRKGDTRTSQINTALDSLRIKGIITDLKQKWLD